MSVRILPDEVRVVRYSQIARSIDQGSSASAVAHRIGVSTPALLAHLGKMGYRHSLVHGWIRDSRA